MTVFEILTIIVAIYAAVLSSILAIKDIIESKKGLEIKLILNSFSLDLELVLQNQGSKPIDLESITLEIGESSEKSETIPSLYIFHEDHTEIFPMCLLPYTSWRHRLNDVFGEKYMRGERFYINIYDSKGRKYSKYSIYENNNRMGGFWKVKG